MSKAFAPDTSRTAIGDRLIAVRQARNYSQSSVANALGLSAQRWGNYEHGKSYPPPEVLARFWQLTGASADFVLFGRFDGLPYELVTLLSSQMDVEDEKSRA